jgi:hypothetical protein
VFRIIIAICRRRYENVENDCAVQNDDGVNQAFRLEVDQAYQLSMMTLSFMRTRGAMETPSLFGVSHLHTGAGA